MKKTVKIRKYKKTGEYYFRLKDLKDIVDVKKVKQYKLEILDNGGFAVIFYDEEGNQIEVKK
jgi:hypothetical protein